MRTAAWLLAATVALAGCATYAPQLDPQAPFIQRAEVQEKQGLRVTVGVPTREEARRHLGVDMGAEGIQPVWVQVENRADQAFVLLPISADPDYFSAAEAAWKAKYGSVQKKGKPPVMLKIYIQELCKSVGKITGEEITQPSDLRKWMEARVDELKELGIEIPRYKGPPKKDEDDKKKKKK